MHEFTWIGWVSDLINHDNIHIFTGFLVSALLVLTVLIFAKKSRSVSEELIPDERVSLKNILQVSVEAILNLMRGVMGDQAKDYLPLIGTLFIYIFINNLIGIIPGFIPATENVNTNFGCALTVFLFYNYMGIKKHGFKNYLKHFMGPIWWMAPLMLIIELISHVVRPVSLSLRLFGNIYGDHLVLGIFSDLVPLVIPVIFLGLGVFVSFIQAFVFSLLSTVYIGLAVAHEEH